MSKREKLRQKIEQNPKNVSFNDLRQLLEWYGFVLKRSKGSHFMFRGKVTGQETLVVIPYQHPIESIYVKKTIELIKQIEEEQEND